MLNIVCHEKTCLASKSFPLGKRLPEFPLGIVVSMGKTRTRRFYFAEWAKKTGKKQRDVVAFTGLNKGYVSLLWSGQKEPGGDTLARIAAALGVTPQALLAHPASLDARASVALSRMPKDQQEIAVDMLEGLAERKRA